MTNEEAKAKLEAYIMCESKKSHFDCGDSKCDDSCHLLYEMGTVGEHNEAINIAIKALTAISELSKSLKAVNRYDMDKKVLIGFNMAIAIFNKCFGESCALKNEQTECDNNHDCEHCDWTECPLEVEKETDGDLISRTDLLNAIWQKEYGKNYDGVNMLDIPHIDIIEQMPSAEKTAEWIPVSDRLPEDRDWYLGIFKESDTGWINPIPFICDYVGRETKATTKDYWILRGITDEDDCVGDYYFNLECVAWMPLPEPYEVEE